MRPGRSGDVVRRADGIAAALPGHGPVLVMLDNHSDHIAAIIGLARQGRLWLPANTKLKASQLAHLLALQSADIAIIDEPYRQTLIDAGFTGQLWSASELDMPGDVPVLPASDALRAIMLTSGTTGMP